MALRDGLPSPRCLLAPECSATLGQGGLFPSSSLPGSGSCSMDRRCLSGVSSFLSFVCCPDPAQPRVGQQRITQSARVLPPGKLDREGGGRQDAAVRPQPLQRERDAWGQAAGQAGGETAWPSGSPPPPRGHTPPLCTGPFVCKDVNASPAGWATPGVQCLSGFSGGKGQWGGVLPGPDSAPMTAGIGNDCPQAAPWLVTPPAADFQDAMSRLLGGRSSPSNSGSHRLIM